jgi:hypothetical protein
MEEPQWLWPGQPWGEELDLAYRYETGVKNDWNDLLHGTVSISSPTFAHAPNFLINIAVSEK